MSADCERHRKPRDIIERDGWLLDAGNEDVGVMVVEEGTIIKGADTTEGLLAGL